MTACARRLNHTWRRSDGRWVHASDLFTTANTARDMARVLDALDLAKVDLYGDSYGTYFAQSFLSRYPSRLRSVVLDSAYEARDLDPWYRTTSPPPGARSTPCAVAPSAAPAARVGAASAGWRGCCARHPVTGRAVGTDAHRHAYTVDVTALVNIVNDAGYDTDPYRQLDAAIRAYLHHGDATPLLRLYAQDVGYDYSDYVRTRPTYYSDGHVLRDRLHRLPAAVRHAPAPRRTPAPAARPIAALPRHAFAPFTAQEWSRVLPLHRDLHRPA